MSWKPFTPYEPLNPQDIFNLLPNVNVESLSKALSGGIRELNAHPNVLLSHTLHLLPPSVKSNDMMLVVYVASLIRSVLALHNLIDNKEQRIWSEKEATKAKVCLDGGVTCRL